MPVIDLDTTSPMPAAPEIEQTVMGSALLEDEALYVMLEQLSEEDFYALGGSSPNQIIFSAIKVLFEQGNGFDLLSLEQHLRDHGQLEPAGGAGYLSELTRSAAGSSNMEYHCQILKEKRIRRQLIIGCQRISEIATDASTDTYSVVEEADNLIFNLMNGSSGNTHEFDKVISDALEHLLSIQGAASGVTGIGTGLDIDHLTGGWQNGDFVVIAARPSMGKTAFVLQCTKHAARQHGAAGLISLEMGYRSLGSRALITEAGIDGQRARTGKLSDNEIDQLTKAAANLKDLGVVIDDTTVVSSAMLRAKARALIHKYGITLLAVDYMQLLTSEKDNREQQVAEISRTCKSIAKEYNIPVLGLSQLSRACEARHGINKRPQLSDLRESGSIEQDADVVAFLFRPEYYGITKYPETEDRDWAGKDTNSICEIIIGKQRNGPTGARRLNYDNKTMRFRNMGPEPNYRLQSMMRGRKPQDEAPF